MRDKKQVKNAFFVDSFLRNWKPTKAGLYSIMYRVYHRGVRNLIASGHTIKPGQWDKTKGQVNSKHPDYLSINSDLNQTISHVNKAIALANLQGKKLNPDDIRRLFGKDAAMGKPVGVLSFWGDLITQMYEEGSRGNARNNVYVRNLFLTFLSKKEKLESPNDPKEREPFLQGLVKKHEFSFDRFDYTLLRNYENFLRKRGLKETSLSIHFRTLRAIFNEAIKRRLADRDTYPFETFKVSKFSTETTPRAIPKALIKKIESLNLSPEQFLWDARNYFLFSYYGCGINFVDLAQLRWKDIDGNVVTYIRQKTGRPIEFMLLENLKDMLSYYEAFTGGHPENYIFPILDREKHATPKQVEYRIDKVDKRVNIALRKLSEFAGITQKITYYTARHTFANELQNAGVPVSKIANLLGHEERVTKVYLQKLSNSQKFTALDHLF